MSFQLFISCAKNSRVRESSITETHKHDSFQPSDKGKNKEWNQKCRSYSTSPHPLSSQIDNLFMQVPKHSSNSRKRKHCEPRSGRSAIYHILSLMCCCSSLKLLNTPRMCMRKLFSKYQDHRKIVCLPFSPNIDQRHVTGLDEKLSTRNKNTDRKKTQ